MFKYDGYVPMLSYVQIPVVVSLFLLIRIVYILSTNNQYKYINIFLSLLVLVYLNFHQKIQLYLLIFLVLTELTSLYLILIITLNVNYFKPNKINYLWVVPLFVIFFDVTELTGYIYFSFYNVSYTTTFSQFFFLFNDYYFIWVINLIVLLTCFILFILTPVSKSHKQNIYNIFSTLTGFINQVPLNLNLFTNPFIIKWS